LTFKAEKAKREPALGLEPRGGMQILIHVQFCRWPKEPSIVERTRLAAPTEAAFGTRATRPHRSIGALVVLQQPVAAATA
jgi:hypothetical protein